MTSIRRLVEDILLKNLGLDRTTPSQVPSLRDITSFEDALVLAFHHSPEPLRQLIVNNKLKRAERRVLADMLVECLPIFKQAGRQFGIKQTISNEAERWAFDQVIAERDKLLEERGTHKLRHGEQGRKIKKWQSAADLKFPGSPPIDYNVIRKMVRHSPLPRKTKGQ